MTLTQKRPTGITILGVLSEIAGVIFIFSGIATVLLGMTVPFILNEGTIIPISDSFSMPIELVGMVASMIGFGYIGIGVFSLVVGIGLLKGRKWAWKLEVISIFISIGIGVFYLIDDVTSGIGTIIISAIILYYLYRPNVKTYFGKNTLTSTIESEGEDDDS